MSMNVIVITNQKGGVAKTTTAINLAAGLALIEAKNNPVNPEKVLFIALDPQGDGALIMAGQFSGGEQSNLSNEITISDLLLDDDPPHPSKVIKSAVIPISLEGHNNLDYIPISPSKQNLLQSQIVNVEMRETRLELMLQTISSIYKYVIVDTPPNVGITTLNALYAATHVIVPMIPNGAGFRFLKDLLATIDKMKRRWNPDLELLGILPSKYTGQRSESKFALIELNRVFGNLMFNPISERSEVQIAYSNGLDIFSFRPPRAGAEQFTSESESAKEFGEFVQDAYNRINRS